MLNFEHWQFRYTHDKFKWIIYYVLHIYLRQNYLIPIPLHAFRFSYIYKIVYYNDDGNPFTQFHRY